MALLTDSWILDLTFVLISVIILIYFYYRKQFRVWQERNVPHFKPTFPFGSTRGMVTKEPIGLTIKGIYDASAGEKYFGFWNLFRPILLIRDLDLIKTILVKDFTNFNHRGIYYNEKDDPLSANMFVLGGARWKYIRNRLSSTFTPAKMKMMFPTLMECVRELDSVLDDHATKEEVIEVKDLMARFTTDVIASCGFGIQANCLKDPNAEFRVWGRKFLCGTLTQICKSILTFHIKQVAEFLKLCRIPKDVSHYFLKAIKETMDHREKNNIKRNDFLQLILELKNQGKLSDDETDQEFTKTDQDVTKTDQDVTKFTLEESVGLVFVFYAAGFEPSSNVLQYCLYELSLHPEIQNNAREEITRVLAKHNGTLSFEAVQEMEYISKLIDETLRKYPPLPFLQRECINDYQIPGTNVIIPKGTLLIVSNIGIQRDPQYYPEPEKFDPERFTEEEKSKRHRFAYLPFGDGPKYCIGMKFGLMQAKVGLITLLAKYKLEITKETPIPLEFNPRQFNLSTRRGIHLKITKV